MNASRNLVAPYDGIPPCLKTAKLFIYNPRNAVSMITISG